MKKTSTIVLSLSAVFLLWLPGAGRKAAIPEQTPGEYLNARPGVAYVGDEVCRDCHEPQYNDFKKTGMGKSLSLPGLLRIASPSAAARCTTRNRRSAQTASQNTPRGTKWLSPWVLETWGEVTWWQKGTRYLFRRSRIIRGFADGISRLVMRPAGSGALHGPPGIFVFRATPESFVP